MQIDNLLEAVKSSEQLKKENCVVKKPSAKSKSSVSSKNKRGSNVLKRSKDLMKKK